MKLSSVGKNFLKTRLPIRSSSSLKNTPEFINFSNATYQRDFEWTKNIPSNFNINEVCCVTNETLLSLVCDQKEHIIADRLIEKYHADFYKKNGHSFSPLELATLFDNDDAKSFLKNKINDNEIEKFIEVVHAKFFVNFFYSTKGFPTFDNRFFNFVEAAFPRVGIDKENRDFILKIVEKVRSGESLIENGKILQISPVAYEDHTAYFVIESNESNFPRFLSYCDSNCPMKEDRGEMVFVIDQKKLSALECDLKEHLQKFFSYNCAEEFYENNGKKIKDALASIVVCQEGEPEPIIFEENIPTKSQTIENCVPKSFFILVRAVFQKLHPEMIFGYDDNNFALSGQRLYDNNREALRREILQTLVNSSIPDQNQFLHHGVAIEALKTGFLKAVKDENLSMIETIYSTLQHNKFNFTAAENFDEFSTLFLSNELQSETLEFLCRQTSMTQDRDHNGYSFLSKINMINSALKSENLDLLIENIVINNPKSYQEIPQTSPISIYQKSNLSNEEAKNLSVIK